jgi:hypothetical protein
VHSCFSHDSYCGPGDDNTGPDTFYSSGASVAARFAEAAAKGVDAIMISDHNDVRAQRDPDFGANGVLGLRAYEHSLAGGGGHAQFMGATAVLPEGPALPHEAAAEHTKGLAAAVEGAGGIFQANHTSYRGSARFERCDQATVAEWDRSPLHWKQGYGVPPTTLEVWNPTTLVKPSEVFWECLLQQGRRVAVTAGSDSHGTNQANLGRPLTWILARDRTEAAVFAALRAGRTTVSRDDGVRLLLEADADRDGRYEAGMGDVVPPGTPMRVRAEGLPSAGVVDVRANGTDLLADRPLLPGQELAFSAPASATGWVRATLRLPLAVSPFDPNCAPSGQSISLCSADQALAGITSPIYVARTTADAPSAERPPGTVTPGPPPSGNDDVPEPDEQRPLPVAQSSGDGRLPDNPRGAAAAAAGGPEGGARLVLSRRALPGRRLRVSCRAPGVVLDRCTVGVLARRGARLARVRTLRLSAALDRVVIAIPRARRIVLRAEAVARDGRRLRASRSLTPTRHRR